MKPTLLLRIFAALDIGVAVATLISGLVWDSPLLLLGGLFGLVLAWLRPSEVIYQAIHRWRATRAAMRQVDHSEELERQDALLSLRRIPGAQSPDGSLKLGTVSDNVLRPAHFLLEGARVPPRF